MNWQRITALVVVISAHVILFGLLMMPPTKYHMRALRQSQMAKTSQLPLIVRLIDPLPRSTSRVPEPPMLPRQRKPRVAIAASVSAPPQVQVSEAGNASAAQKQTRTGDLNLAVPNLNEKGFTVSRDLTKGVLDQRRIKLPGGQKVAEAPHFEMVDPRSQGIAGVIHFIGALTGAVDPHCLDLDAWRGMTVKERLAHGVSSSDIQEIEDNYNCRQLRHH